MQLDARDESDRLPIVGVAPGQIGHYGQSGSQPVAYRQQSYRACGTESDRSAVENRIRLSVPRLGFLHGWLDLSHSLFESGNPCLSPFPHDVGHRSGVRLVAVAK